MDLKTVRDELDRVAKNQELTTMKYQQVIDQINDEITQAITDLQSADNTSSIDHKSVIENLKVNLYAYTQEQFQNLEIYEEVDLSNILEILGKFVETDISKAYCRNVVFDSHRVNQIILNFLYQEDLFDVGDIFIDEVQDPDINISLRPKFTEMHQIFDALIAQNLDPLDKWFKSNHRKLGRSSGPRLEFDLRRLQFLNLLEEKKQLQALNFAKTYLSPFARKNRKEFLNLMGCLLWPGKLNTSPYSYLLGPELWVRVTQKFLFEFCDLMGISFRNPLTVTLEAGAKALPTFLEKASEVRAALREMTPVDVELEPEFQFHSNFVCSVSLQPVCMYNPAEMITCGHVFSHESISILSENFTRPFNCPRCRRRIRSNTGWRMLKL